MRKMFPKILLAGLLFVGGCVSTSESVPELQERIATAERAIEIADYERANEIIQDLGDGSSEVQVELSLKLLRHAASSGSAKALIGLGKLYLNGIDVPQDPETAFAFFETAANAGDAEAIYLLGRMHQTGQGTKRDVKRARELYMEASYQGIENAQFEYAVMWHAGEGGEQDIHVARDWYQKSAKNGHVPSELLGAMLDTLLKADGRGWFRREEILEMQYTVNAIERVMPTVKSSLIPLQRILDKEDVEFSSSEMTKLDERIAELKNRFDDWLSQQK